MPGKSFSTASIELTSRQIAKGRSVSETCSAVSAGDFETITDLLIESGSNPIAQRKEFDSIG